MTLGDFPLGQTIDLHFTTRRFSTGAPFTLAGTPVISAYEDNSTTEITAGITLTVDFDARTGLNHVRVVATGGNGYETGKSYSLVITTGTVDSVSVVGEVVGYFTIERSAAYSRLGAPAGASVSADVAAVKAETASIQGDTNDIQTRLPAALVIGRIDASVGAMAADVVTAAAVANGAIDAATFAAGAIDAAAIATDAIGAAELSQAAADKVWSSSTRSLTDKVGFALSAAGIQAIWDALTSALTTVGSIGKLLVDNLNATISSRASQASVDALPTAASNADAVWDEARAGHVAAGSFGQGVASVQGNVTGSVGSIAAGGITAPSFGAGAIDAAAIGAGAIDADALAADAGTEIADALLKRDMSAVTGEAARSPLNALRALRNKTSITGATLTVTKEDDSTTAWTAAVTTDAAANPVTAVDPA